MEHKKIPRYPNYLIREDGTIFKLVPLRNKHGHVTEELLGQYRLVEQKQTLNKEGGYLRISFNAKNVHVAKIVAEAYYGPRPDGYQIDHVDGNKLNNHYTNLEYVTASENMRRATAKGLNVLPKGHGVLRGEANRSCKISEETAKAIKNLKGKTNRNGFTAQVIADSFGVKRRLVYAIWSGQLWKHI